MKFVLVISALLLFLASCTRIEEPQFRRVERFGVKKLGLQQAVIGFDATFHNPNKFGVTVKEAVFDFYADTVYIGKFVQPKEVTVNPRGEFSIPMEGTISWLKALDPEVQRMAGKEVLLKAAGNVKLGKAGVFINKEIKYQGRHTLDLGLLKNPAGAGFQ
jgi:LEA14-like dessication related protein